MINTQAISVVFQGGIDPALLGSGNTDGSDFLYNVARTRESLPHATLILSTWKMLELPESYNTAEKLGIDKLILSLDPQGLPNIKFGHDYPNNVNRQITSTQAGLATVTTDYVLKMRADSFLSHADFLSYYQDYQLKVADRLSQVNGAFSYSPIVVPNFFTIDPRVYEHMAFHISDWSQFGETTTLRTYWSAEPMTRENATYFERQSQDSNANFADNSFRTRLAVEQHITTQYARLLGYTVPTQYNDLTPAILHGYEDFLAKHIIVLDMADFGLNLPKYAWALTDDFMAMNCINHDDWYQLFYEYWQADTVSHHENHERLNNARRRKMLKSQASHTFERYASDEQARVLSKLYP